MAWKPDPDCRICKGSGTLIENERVIDGEYWCSFVDCDCLHTKQDIAKANAAYADYLANGGTTLEDLKRELGN
jgi:hypothetical protein